MQTLAEHVTRTGVVSEEKVKKWKKERAKGLYLAIFLPSLGGVMCSSASCCVLRV